MTKVNPTPRLRTAAYCQIVGGEEQSAVLESQKTCYTEHINANPDWIMAGIFADIGDSCSRRPEFQKMLRKCRQKKIDLVLVKSISRFARNTVDCLNYIRALRTLGIAVIFEKENINTLETDSEMLITMMGAFAQAESESMSANIVWGKRQAMREGKTNVQFQHLYGYELDEDGKPRIVPEQAAVVKQVRVGQARTEVRRVALCQPGGLRLKILPRLSHAPGGPPASRHPRRHQHCHEPAGGTDGAD